MSKYKVMYWEKTIHETEIEAESEEQARQMIIDKAGEEPLDMIVDDYGATVVGRIKPVPIEVKVTVSARFNQDAANVEDAINTVKHEIAIGSFDLALLTDYDMQNAQVVYVGNPSEDGNKEP